MNASETLPGAGTSYAMAEADGQVEFWQKIVNQLY